MISRKGLYIRMLFFVALFFIFRFSNSNKLTLAGGKKLIKLWESDTILKTPESVLYDASTEAVYVSNINGKSGEKDGNGFISKLTKWGKADVTEWVKGLDAPKGMGLYNGKLYVADLTRLVVIDVATAAIVKQIEVKDAKFLNDITIDASGLVYISDSGGKKIYKYENDKISVFAEDEKWMRPNGLLATEKGLLMMDMDAGILYIMEKGQKEFKKVADGLTKGDGIKEAKPGEYFVSNWNGEINYVNSKGEVERLLDTKELKLNAADIEYIPSQKCLIVPTFFGNKVMWYELR